MDNRKKRRKRLDCTFDTYCEMDTQVGDRRGKNGDTLSIHKFPEYVLEVYSHYHFHLPCSIPSDITGLIIEEVPALGGNCKKR